MTVKFSKPVTVTPFEPLLASPKMMVELLFTARLSVPLPKLDVPFVSVTVPPLILTVSLPPPRVMRPVAVPPLMVMVMLPEKVEFTSSLAVTVPDVKLMFAVSVVSPPVKETAEPLVVIVPVLATVIAPVSEPASTLMA